MELDYFHRLNGAREQAARAALLLGVQHPDEGSEFEALISRMSGTPEEKLLRLSASSFESLLAFRDTSVVGYLALRREPFRTHIFSVYVDAFFRNQGVGSRLLYHEMNESFKGGVREIRAGKGSNAGMTRLLVRAVRHYRGPFAVEINLETGVIQNKGLKPGV